MLLNKPHKNQGAAIIMALMIVAIVAALATVLMVGQRILINQTQLQVTSDQTYFDSQYTLPWVSNELQQIVKASKQENAKPVVWPVVLPDQTLEDGNILKLEVYPANARFNLNNLSVAVAPYLTLFANLIQAVDNKITPAQALQLAQNVQAWMIPVVANGDGVNPYATLSPSYQAPHMMMANASELRLVQGITSSLYAALKPYVVALPANNIPININAASPTVLLALFNNNQSAVDAVMSYRNANGSFMNIAAFTDAPSVKTALGANQTQLQTWVTTDFPTYFLVITTIKGQDSEFHQSNLLQFSAENKTISSLGSD
jgi:general secretion pathway protein K